MALSEDMRDLVCKFGQAKMRQGVCNQPGYTTESHTAIEASKEAYDKLCYEIEILELKGRHWDEHRCDECTGN